MILSNEDIKKHIKTGEIKVEPLSADQIGPASIDLALDDIFYQIKPEYRNKEIFLDRTNLMEVLEEFRSKEVKIKPGELLLGRTKEKITLPSDICAMLEGRTRFARVGLAIHVTSKFINPGANNRQILEIVNLSQSILVLKEGMRICQVIFQKLLSPTSKPYDKFGSFAVNQ